MLVCMYVRIVYRHSSAYINIMYLKNNTACLNMLVISFVFCSISRSCALSSLSKSTSRRFLNKASRSSTTTQHNRLKIITIIITHNKKTFITLFIYFRHIIFYHFNCVNPFRRQLRRSRTFLGIGLARG